MTPRLRAKSCINQTLEHRRKTFGIKFGLDRVKAALEYLGSPEKKFRSILIGGTNGKGSVTFYLSNLFCKLTDYKVGRYTSPHLINLNERFVINEKIYLTYELNQFSEKIIHEIRDFEDKTSLERKLTEFEVLTIIAFCLFEKEKVDIATLEIGMGGTLDATNVVDDKNTLCSIITNVSLDHTQFLGDTLEKIAYEKAGIIKENSFVITEANNTALNVIKKIADERNSKLIQVENTNNIYYQDKNIETALKAWEIIKSKITIKENNTNERCFLSSLQIPGRYQFIKNKKILLDGAHNPQAAIELRKLIERDAKNKKLIYIIGMLDKDYKNFIRNLIPKNSTVICIEPKSERATKKELLEEVVRDNKGIPIVASDLNEAIKIAKEQEHDLIVITGSLYLVGEAFLEL